MKNLSSELVDLLERHRNTTRQIKDLHAEAREIEQKIKTVEAHEKSGGYRR